MYIILSEPCHKLCSITTVPVTSFPPTPTNISPWLISVIMISPSSPCGLWGSHGYASECHLVCGRVVGVWFLYNKTKQYPSWIFKLIWLSGVARPSVQCSYIILDKICAVSVYIRSIWSISFLSLIFLLSISFLSLFYLLSISYLSLIYVLYVSYLCLPFVGWRTSVLLQSINV